VTILRVVFIQPPNKDVFMCTPLLGVGYLMGYLKNKGVECEYIDGVKTRQSIKEIVEVCRNKTPDLIAVTIMTVFYNNAKKLINALSQLNIPIVIGGAHVSALPVKTLKDLKGDYAIYGEGEKTLYKLVEHLKNKKNDIRKIEGMVYKDNRGNVIKNPPMSLIENLDELPLPAWDLMDPRTYPFAPHGSIAKEYPVAPILTSRGCPFSCDFCSVNVIWRNKYRMRSIENVVDEIEFLVKKYGVKEIHFEDDNLTLTKGRGVKLCKEITRRKLRFIWSCPNGVRIDSLDEETLRFMKRSGCYSLTFGIESGNQEILNNVNKRLNLKVVKRVVDMTKKSGIETRAFFIIGLPGSTYEKDMKSIGWMIKKRIFGHFSYYVPFDKEMQYDKNFFGKGAVPLSDEYPKEQQKKIYDLAKSFNSSVKVSLLKRILDRIRLVWLFDKKNIHKHLIEGIKLVISR